MPHAILDAARAGLDAVEALLQQEAPPAPQVLLEAALYCGHPEVRRRLARLATERTLEAGQGELTEGHAAAMIGTTEAADRADSRGADWGATYYYRIYGFAMTPLALAIALDELAFARTLLERGLPTAVPFGDERFPKTVLSVATAGRHHEAVRMLLAHGIAPAQWDLPPVGLDLATLDALIAAGLDINALTRDALDQPVWYWAHVNVREVEALIGWLAALKERGFVIDLARLIQALDHDFEHADADALGRALLDLGGEALAAEIAGASGEQARSLMRIAWHRLSLATLQRLVELGAPLAAQRIKRSWHEAEAKQEWLQQREDARRAALPSLAEFMTLSDDQLTSEIVVGVLARPGRGPALAGLEVGSAADAVDALEVLESEADLGSPDAARHLLEIDRDADGRILGVSYALQLVDEERADACFDALEQAFAARLGKKGRGRKGKRARSRTWQLGDRRLQLSRYREVDSCLDVHLRVELRRCGRGRTPRSRRC
jgi:hypothetical protein